MESNTLEPTSDMLLGLVKPIKYQSTRTHKKIKTKTIDSQEAEQVNESMCSNA